MILWHVGRAANGRVAAWRAGAAGAGYFALAMSWIVEPFLVEPEIYGWMAPFALILLAIGGGLFWAVPGWVAGRFAPGWQARAAAFGAGLVLSDWLRSWIFTGLPWAQLGHIWVGTPVAQSAAYIGAIGLSAITVCAAALPLTFWRLSRPSNRGALPGLVLSTPLIATLWVAGLNRLDTPISERGITLRLVQPNAEQALKWNPEWAQIFWQRLLEESAAPASGRHPDAVIWPSPSASC